MAAGEIRIRSLLVRPFQSADLAFTVAGVLDWENERLARLGAAVTEYSLERELYKFFEGPNRTGNDVYDAAKIVGTLVGDAKTVGPALFGLRNHVLRADLDEAVKRQANAILQRYAHTADIVKAFELLYPQIININRWPPEVADSVADWNNVTKATPLSVMGRLRALSDSINERFDKLKTAYGTEAVLKEVVGTSVPEGAFASETSTNGYPTINVQTFTVAPGETTIKDKDGNEYQKITYQPTTSSPAAQDNGTEYWRDLGNGKKSQTTTTTYQKDKFVTTTKNGLSAFAHRPAENTTSLLRAQLDLIEQSLQEFLYSLSVESVGDVMNNERVMIDLGVRRLQVNLALTYLVPPFAGIVTSVYKDRGESVAAGEPVIRIEDDSRLYLVGTINYRGLLEVTRPPAEGKIQVITKSLFEDGETATIENVSVRSIRGHDADNDEWDVVLECENSVSVRGRKIKLPLNYQFDRDDTVIKLP